MGSDASVLPEGVGDPVEEETVVTWTESCGVGVVGACVLEVLVLLALSLLPGKDEPENGSALCAGEGAGYSGLNASCSSSNSSIMRS